MGLFTGKKPTTVQVMYQRLSDNPHYPFEKIADQKYVMKRQFTRLYWAIGSAMGCFIGLVYHSRDNPPFDTLFLLICTLFVVSASMIYLYKDARVYKLNEDTMTYIFQIGNKYTYEGQYHNIYIRLIRRIDMSTGNLLYYLTLNGYKMEHQLISPASRNRKDMRKVGQKIAEALTINYFDISDRSRHHVVRHKRDGYQAKTPGIKQTLNSDGSASGVPAEQTVAQQVYQLKRSNSERQFHQKIRNIEATKNIDFKPRLKRRKSLVEPPTPTSMFGTQMTPTPKPVPQGGQGFDFKSPYV
eukprot:GFYU01009404.1.p1 GENE.GFYU01009404.1~~GFYU01009404.1.p1  ORF type:complete len:299 (+),score=66.80 GFYU01009404.1:131-1027(+)